jgi:hypothetical protein
MAVLRRANSPSKCVQDPYFQINSDGKQTRGLNTKGRRRRRKHKAELLTDLINGKEAAVI